MARRRRRRAIVLGILLVMSLVSWRSWARPLRLFDLIKPRPDFGNIRYGPHERNVLDLWKAKSRSRPDVATPVVIFFHGGGFRSGDKSSVPTGLLARCLEAGISVASANYRLTQMAAFPAPMLDGVRAIQYLRSHAQELEIDPARIAASGSSAGAGIALWVAFHDDLADPDSPDPVARQSSRLSCAGVDGAQTSYDPRFIKALIGGRAHEHPALPLFYGLTADGDEDSPRAHKLYEEASPLNHVSSGDPPVILFYAEPKGALPAGAKPGQGIHHPRFGDALKAQLDPLKIECILHHSSEYPKNTDPIDGMCRDMTEFFVRKLRPG
jgi:acetyl esterase